MITSYTSPNDSFLSKAPDNTPCIFLAGPILGASDWQSDACAMLREIALDMQLEKLAIFNPRQPQFKDLSDFTDETFYQQVEIEHSHLAVSKNRGVRLFWLCNKTVDIPHRNYALTTLFELGEAIGYAHDICGDLIIVAIEEGFTNKKYLDYTIAKKAPNVILTDSLEDACFQAVKYLKEKK